METGLLWFDNDPRTSLEEKIRRAACRYAQKFGQPATLCILNPKALAALSGEPPREVLVEGRAVKVLAARQVLPHHFWVGVAKTP